MSFTRDIILRYSFSGRQSGFTRLVARASMLGMVLGVASLITVMSVMNGFAAELNSRILALVAHVTVRAEQGGFTDWQAQLDKFLKHDAVRGGAPFIEDTVLFEAWSRQRGVRLTGIDLSAQRSVNALDRRIVRGDLGTLETRRFTVAIGTTLAQMLGVGVGDRIEVTLPTLSITPMGVFPRTRQLEVVAEFEVGSDLDATQAYVSLESARRLFARSGVDGLQLKLEAPEAVEEMVPQLRAQLPGNLVLTDWRESQGSLFTAVKMEKITVGLLLMAVIAVAAFNIVSTLTMSVTEKAGDIAVLRVMGLSAGAVMLIFMGHGLALGGVGIVVGGVVGVLLALNVSELAAWFEQVSGSYLFDPQVYYIGRLPSVLQWQDVLVTLAVALLLSTLASVYPAWRAARIQPVEALNHV